jgi:adenylate cyclase
VNVFTNIDFPIVSSYIFNMACIFLILIVTSYWRERFARQEFIRQLVQEKERSKLSNFLSSYIPLNMFTEQPNKGAEAFGEVTLTVFGSSDSPL